MSNESDNVKVEQSNTSKAQPAKHLRRFGCLAIIVLWVCVTIVSVSGAMLAIRGELVHTNGELGERRLWLVQEGGNRGLGYSYSHVTSGSEDSGQACVQTSVRFLLWRSDEGGQGTSYCQCFEKTDNIWQVTAACTP